MPHHIADKDLEGRVEEFCKLLLRRGILRRCERMYKKPRPGKKRLAKWPRKLVPVADATTWTEDAFYPWMYERPTSPWTYVWSGLMVVLVIAACCFPLAPYRVKLAVFYGSASLLILIFGTILVRAVVALLTWIPTGTAFWIFPNMLADDVPITAAFKPLYSYDPPEEGKGTHWALRVGALAVVACICSVLYTVAPDKTEVASGAKQAHDALLEWLVSQPAMKGIEGGNNATGNATDNATDNVSSQTPPVEAAETAEAVPPLDELLKDLGLEEEEEEEGGTASGSSDEL